MCSEPLKILDSHESLVACIFTNMPSHLRRMLSIDLISCFHAESWNLQETDSAAAGTEFQFQAVHFSWYNRHATRVSLSVSAVISNFHAVLIFQGDDVPQDVHPMLLGKKDLRTNYSQMLPYTSKDMLEHADTYHNLQVVFDNVFTWVAEQVSMSLTVTQAVNHVFPPTNRFKPRCQTSTAC